jgi:hypothetical protein
VKGERVGSLGMEEGPCHELLSLPWSLTQVCSLETPSVPSACNTHTHTHTHTCAYTSWGPSGPMARMVFLKRERQNRD